MAPLDLHAAYTGIARSLGSGDTPVLLWARPQRAHLSIGASQHVTADVDMARCEALGIPVIQRCLGGGTVWLDGEQECYFFIVPARQVRGGHRGLSDLCLGLSSDWFAAMGLPVRRAGDQDLRVGARKILGSGASTQGEALVFGASVLRHFPARRFSECIRVPGSGFRGWLAEALAEGMTDWRREGFDPTTPALQTALRNTCRRRAGWELADWTPGPKARQAIAAAREELSEPLDMTPGRRHVPHGIRINGQTYLLECDTDSGWLRLILDDGIIRRIAAADPDEHEVLQSCLGEPVHRGRLRDRLAKRLHAARAERLAGRIESLCESIPR